MEREKMKESLKELIITSLDADYISISNRDGIKTGNRYQSIKLGDEQTSGFRTDRSHILDQIDFSGKKVLDLGSNLGELSRGARVRGAWLVDGFELDERFIQTANLINAFNDVTRVSFFRRDVTDPAIYSERYDIVLAFSVFPYIEGVMERLADITDELFVLETHRVEGGLESTYISPISRHFPCYEMVGSSDWGINHDATAQRAVVAFAKHERSLTQGLKRGVTESPERQEPSPGPDAADPPRNGKQWHVDSSRTIMYDRFFSCFSFPSVDELLTAIGKMEIDLDSMLSNRDLSRSLVSGWLYWWFFVKGYVEYVSLGVVEEQNPYVCYLARHYLLNKYDPVLSRNLDEMPKIVQRVQQRFRDFDTLRRLSENDPRGDILPAVTVALWDANVHRQRSVYLLGDAAPSTAVLLDGFHRLFLYRMFGIAEVNCTVFEGSIESLGT